MTKENEPNQTDEQLGKRLFDIGEAVARSVFLAYSPENYESLTIAERKHLDETALRFRDSLMKSEQLPDIGREAIGKRLFEIEKRVNGYAKIVTWGTLNDCERENFRKIAEEINRSIGRALARNQGVLKSEGVTRCCKCGSADIHTAYHQTEHDCSYDQRDDKGSDREHLHYHCRGCSYTWTGATLDTKPIKEVK